MRRGKRTIAICILRALRASVVLLCGCGCGGCAAVDIRPLTQNQARLQGSINALATVVTEIQASVTTTANVATAVQATVAGIATTQSAGRDVNAFDYWGFRAMVVGIFAYVLVDRVADRRRRDGRAGGG